MAYSHPTPLSLAALLEIDGLSFVKAGTILDEARNRLKASDFDLTVRRSQEAFELYVKSLFRFLQTEYSASHDLKKQIYELTEALKQYQIDRRQIARLVLANSMLQLWRSPAFYGDETLNVGGLFDGNEATLAISYAELSQIVCIVVRSHIYSRAAV
jgi:HEPN domain-containing protein